MFLRRLHQLCGLRMRFGRVALHALTAFFALTLILPGHGSVLAAEPSSKAAAQKSIKTVQSRIRDARFADIDVPGLPALTAIANEIRGNSVHLQSKQMEFQYRYWLAYTNYLLANGQLEAGQMDAARASLIEASTLLRGIQVRNAESYTLLGMVSGLQIAVMPQSQIGELMSGARDAMEKAVALAPDSPRVLYARAVGDYSTPAQYGGGRLAEGLLRKVLAMPAERNRALQPIWGRDDSAALLIKVLAASDRNAEAKKTYQEFIALYPKSAPLITAGKGL